MCYHALSGTFTTSGQYVYARMRIVRTYIHTYIHTYRYRPTYTLPPSKHKCTITSTLPCNVMSCAVYVHAQLVANSYIGISCTCIHTHVRTCPSSPQTQSQVPLHAYKSHQLLILREVGVSLVISRTIKSSSIPARKWAENLLAL